VGKILDILAHEMHHHIPFTIFGAITGILLMSILIVWNQLASVSSVSEEIFYILHPTHILLSAIVTTTIFLKYQKRKIWIAIVIGYIGSIGIATLSDSLIPYIGELILGLPNTGIHIGFIEEPFLTNPPAFIGIILAIWKGTTKFPHAGHVLMSTWASLFHVIMALGSTVSIIQMVGIFIFLFFAVWIPCCASDIWFPLIFPFSNEKINNSEHTGNSKVS
jgi:hypothetical protein